MDSSKKLLALARKALAAELAGENFAVGKVEKEWQPKRATFVTLTKNGELRGCIGSLAARRPLHEDVAANAVSAAFADPRFPPLTREELPQIKIEISILTPPRDLKYADAADLLTQLRPGRDGVILTSGWHSATYLPQVWEDLPGKEEFLASLCAKAGLPFDAWRHEKLAIQTYEVEKFRED